MLPGGHESATIGRQPHPDGSDSKGGAHVVQPTGLHVVLPRKAPVPGAQSPAGLTSMHALVAASRARPSGHGAASFVHEGSVHAPAVGSRDEEPSQPLATTASARQATKATRAPGMRGNAISYATESGAARRRAEFAFPPYYFAFPPYFAL